MNTLHLKIITPQKISLEEDINSVTVPSTEGELTILPRHMKLFTVLKQGIVTIRKPNSEEHLAIGGGYLETDGKDLNLLVSRAYGQDEIDAKETEKAIEEAKKIISTSKSDVERRNALEIMRRSVLDLTLLKKRKQRSASQRV